MGEIVNLRRARKVRNRDAAATLAAVHRAAHGRTNAQKQSDTAEQARRDTLLNGAKRDE